MDIAVQFFGRYGNYVRVLISGSSGFIGRSLCQYLSDCGHLVHRIVRITGESTAGTSQRGDRWEVNWPYGLQDLPFGSYDCVIHLAYGSANQNQSEAEVIQLHTRPVSLMLSACRAQDAAPHVIFLSSQSAGASAISLYGKGKYAAEQLLRDSRIPWTIIRPGLVIAREAGGLFKIFKQLIQKLPILLVPSAMPFSASDVQIQPVALSDLVEVIQAVLGNAKAHGETISLALEPRPLVHFLNEVKYAYQSRCLLIKFPLRLFLSLLAVSERLIPGWPFPPERLSALMAGAVPQRSTGSLFLKRQLLSVNEALGLPISLSSQCNFIYKRMFRENPPCSLVARFCQAHRTLAIPESDPILDHLIDTGGNLEFAELYTRQRRGPLTQKCELINYLAEVEPSRYHSFYNTHASWSRGMIQLIAFALQTVYQRVVAAALSFGPSSIRKRFHG